jgi:hypothetical protein
MTKNPFVNALAATSYISIIAMIMNYGSKNSSGPDNWVAPVAVVSLFTLSAGVMAYLFVYQPLVMYFDGKKQAAVKLFLQTLGVFSILHS